MWLIPTMFFRWLVRVENVERVASDEGVREMLS